MDNNTNTLADLPLQVVPKHSFTGLTQELYEKAIEHYHFLRRTAEYWSKYEPFSQCAAEVSASGARRDLYKLGAFEDEPLSLVYGPASLPEGTLFSIEGGRILMEEAFYYELRMQIYHARSMRWRSPVVIRQQTWDLASTRYWP